MDYEKKYKEVLERANHIYNTPVNPARAVIVKEVLDYVFPQLEEDNNEKIKMALLDYFDDMKKADVRANGIHPDTIIKWLKGRGEQKSMEVKDSSSIDPHFYKPEEVRTTGHWNVQEIEQKPADKKGVNLVEEEMTPFQKEVFCIIDTTIEEEKGLKQVCDKLFTLASNEIKQKTAWSEEDDNCLSTIIAEFSTCAGRSVSKDEWMRCNDFLNSLRERVQPQNTWGQVMSR